MRRRPPSSRWRDRASSPRAGKSRTDRRDGARRVPTSISGVGDALHDGRHVGESPSIAAHAMDIPPEAWLRSDLEIAADSIPRAEAAAGHSTTRVRHCPDGRGADLAAPIEVQLLLGWIRGGWSPPGEDRSRNQIERPAQGATLVGSTLPGRRRPPGRRAQPPTRRRATPGTGPAQKDAGSYPHRCRKQPFHSWDAETENAAGPQHPIERRRRRLDRGIHGNILTNVDAARSPTRRVGAPPMPMRPGR